MEYRTLEEFESAKDDAFAIILAKNVRFDAPEQFDPNEYFFAGGYHLSNWREAENSDDMLEAIYEIFNISHPEDYQFRSLSVGDIVAVNLPGQKLTAYAVDHIGFKEIEWR